MSFRLFVTVCFAGLALFLASGCERGDNQTLSSEADEPNYRQGQQLVKQGRSQEALSAYLKVIAKRGESAPESHLEAGLLYLQQIKDPLAAIYHFRKYLELQPNSRQAIYVKGRIDVAKREFARTLPAAPTENQAGLDLLDKVDRLQRENEDLKAELIALRAGGPLGSTRTRASLNDQPAAQQRPQTDQALRPFITAASEPAVAEDSPISLAPEAPAEAAERPVLRQSLPQVQPVRAAPTKPTAPSSAPSSAAVRRHLVVKGDTLFSLAQKYYGNRSRWRDIYAANRDVLPSENSLRLGMEIKIP